MQTFNISRKGFCVLWRMAETFWPHTHIAQITAQIFYAISLSVFLLHAKHCRFDGYSDSDMYLYSNADMFRPIYRLFDVLENCIYVIQPQSGTLYVSYCALITDRKKFPTKKFRLTMQIWSMTNVMCVCLMCIYLVGGSLFQFDDAEFEQFILLSQFVWFFQNDRFVVLQLMYAFQ